jgi:hypothetical protein
MAHVLLLGMTLSGKTHKAKALSHDYKNAGVGVLVLDPLRDPGWSADFITDDPDEFLNVYWNSRGCMAFMDEGGESVGRYDVTMQKTATRGRHWGHTNHYIAQRATQLAPLVRDQCTRLFLFCSSTKDGEVLAREWNRPELEGCSQLKQGEYYYAVKMGSISTNRRSVQNGSVPDHRRAVDDRDGSHRESRPGKTRVRSKGAATGQDGQNTTGRTGEGVDTTD